MHYRLLRQWRDTTYSGKEKFLCRKGNLKERECMVLALAPAYRGNCYE